MGWKLVVASVLAVGLAFGGFYLYRKPDTPAGSYAHFSYFMQRHNRNYRSAEEIETRFSVFKRNLGLFNAINAERRSFKVGVGPFADMTFEEFKRARLMRPIPNPSRPRPLLASIFAGELERDWVKEGKVSPVKNQSQCGSCWAFAAIGALEAAQAIRTGPMVLFSEQELVDCAQKYGNFGCQGGLPNLAYDYIKDRGISLAADYPYTGRGAKCKAAKKPKQRIVAGYEMLSEVSPDGIIALLNRSPVAVGVEVQLPFMHYRSGVFSAGSDCGEEINHAVLLTGVRVSKDEKYFTLKNSWGEGWGEKGYMRIGFGDSSTGVCGMIGELDVIPLVAQSA